MPLYLFPAEQNCPDIIKYQPFAIDDGSTHGVVL